MKRTRWFRPFSFYDAKPLNCILPRLQVNGILRCLELMMSLARPHTQQPICGMNSNALRQVFRVHVSKLDFVENRDENLSIINTC